MEAKTSHHVIYISRKFCHYSYSAGRRAEIVE